MGVFVVASCLSDAHLDKCKRGLESRFSIHLAGVKRRHRRLPATALPHESASFASRRRMSSSTMA